MKLITTSAALLLFTAAGVWAQEPPTSATGASEPVTIAMKGRDGSDHGTIMLTQTPKGALVSAKLTGLPDGPHGFHFHETGVCEAPFESAGGHYNPTDRDHGFKMETGAHAGDMGNFTASGGVAAFDMLNPAVSLTGGEAPLNDADGSTIVIHADADDYMSQPAGASGDRIACGVIFAAQ